MMCHLPGFGLTRLTASTIPDENPFLPSLIDRKVIYNYYQAKQDLKRTTVLVVVVSCFVVSGRKHCNCCIEQRDLKIVTCLFSFSIYGVMEHLPVLWFSPLFIRWLLAWQERSHGATTA